MGTNPPVHEIGTAQAAQILGCSPAAVYQLVYKGELVKASKYKHGGLDRDAVEKLAAERWHPGHPYWVSNTEASDILGISRQRVAQLARQGRLPYRDRPDGRRLFRRQQLEVIANARAPKRLG